VKDKQAKNNAPQQPGRVKFPHLGTSLRDGTVGGALGAGMEEVRAAGTPLAAGFDVLGAGIIARVLLSGGRSVEGLGDLVR
jgi:hypothetical protein